MKDPEDPSNSPEYLGIRFFSSLFREQNQYFSRYLNPDKEVFLGEGLRILWVRPGDYHRVYIHVDDGPELIKRVNEHRVRSLIGHTVSDREVLEAADRLDEQRAGRLLVANPAVNREIESGEE